MRTRVLFVVVGVIAIIMSDGCISRCLVMDNTPLDERLSFDVLRTMGSQRQAPDVRAGIDRVEVFVEENEHWDMDIACRFAQLRRLQRETDGNGAPELLTALDADGATPEAMSTSPDCKDGSRLYHVLFHHKDRNQFGYLLVRPCVMPDGRVVGRLTAYNAEGDVSVRSAAHTVEALGSFR